MAKVLQRTEVSLRSFYIFNAKLGAKDGEEHKKVLYYHPKDIELNTKIKDVGLSEAIIAFTGTFKTNDDDVCRALHTQKTTQLFYQPEPDYWMVLVLNVPKEIRTKDGIEVPEYRGNEVHDRIYKSVLEQCYDMFRVFYGTFQMNFTAVGSVQDDESTKTEANRIRLQKTFEEFYDKYLANLRFPIFDITAVMRSLQYLPLDKTLFLRAHNFVNTIRATFPLIIETMLLYKEQVVCSGKLHPIDIYCLNEYVVGTLLNPPSVDAGTASISPSTLMRSNSTNAEIYRNGAFLTESSPLVTPSTSLSGENAKHNEQSIKKSSKRLFLGRNNKRLEQFFFIAYRALDVTICLLLKDDPQDEFYSELHSYIAPQLCSISNDISETLAKSTQMPRTSSSSKLSSSASNSTTLPSSGNSDPTDAPKYLFVNEQSLWHLSNIHVDQRRSKLTTSNIPANIINLIADLSDSKTDGTIVNKDHWTIGNGDFPSTCFSSSSGDFKETLVKTTNDYWIVRRCSNYRQYFVIILNSKATLLDVTLEAKRIFEQELTDNVFFDK